MIGGNESRNRLILQNRPRLISLSVSVSSHVIRSAQIKRSQLVNKEWWFSSSAGGCSRVSADQSVSSVTNVKVRTGSVWVTADEMKQTGTYGGTAL